MSTLLAIDVSNTHTGIAWWPDEADEASDPPHWQISSDPNRTVDELRVLLARLLADEGRNPAEVEACVIACVVPEILGTLCATCRRMFGIEPLVVGPGVKSGLRIRTENPREVGPDRIAGAVAAVARFGGPVLVLDFSTALTVDVVGAEGDYLGAIIAPGIEIAAEALARRAARLHRFELTPPPRAIADDTDAALRSGMVFGYLGLVEGLVARVHRELGPAPVIATGDGPWLPELLAHTRVIDAYDPLLTLRGLRRIHRRHIQVRD